MTSEYSTVAVHYAPTDILHVRVERFYAWQMQLLDSGEIEQWAATFTEDGSFGADGLPAPVRGRQDIAASARKVYDDLTSKGIRRRHWLGMLTVDAEDELRVRARCYAMVYQIPRGGEPTPHRSTTCEDILVYHEGSWLVEERVVHRDDLG